MKAGEALISEGRCKTEEANRKQLVICLHQLIINIRHTPKMAAGITAAVVLSSQAHVGRTLELGSNLAGVDPKNWACPY